MDPQSSLTILISRGGKVLNSILLPPGHIVLAIEPNGTISSSTVTQFGDWIDPVVHQPTYDPVSQDQLDIIHNELSTDLADLLLD